MKSWEMHLAEIIERFFNALKELDADTFSSKPNPSKWSKKEIVGHLCDSARINEQRFYLSKSTSEYIFSTYDQDQRVIASNYQLLVNDKVIEMCRSALKDLQLTYATIPESKKMEKVHIHNFDQICLNTIPKNQEVNLAYLFWDFIDHLEHHIKQIFPDYKRTLPRFRASIH